MAKQNIAFLYGRVSKLPIISKNEETNEYIYGMTYIDTVRGYRAVGDELKFVKHDHPLIMSAESEILNKMQTWKENDIVFIKGVITSRHLKKTSFCPDCTDEDGNPFRNDVLGNIVYVTPIYAEKVRSYDTKMEAVEDVVKNREISNQIYIYGTLLRDPKIFTTARKLQICQYPIAINRKLTIRTDDPTIKTDYPIVKSYGEQARDDKTYLKYQAEVIVDGFLQARTVTRKITCKNCGKQYEWHDHCMEIVPYAMEYVKGYKSEDEIIEETKKSAEEYKQMLYNTATTDIMDEAMKSDDLK